ncbi:DUF4856 domain-containing protein [Marinoscillum luteum]|uniref:DUF4856 domain-containing protein n=1 Tax=Marinoscillum luteum TaxID=861051 RepID=A0ABW7N6M2_9BACT
MNKLNTILLISGTLLTGALSSCNEGDDDEVSLEIPSTYEFTRDGASTVDYSGQTARLDMLAELKAYIGTANDGAVLSEEVLLDMFANENNPFSSAELNESGKQLKDKTFAADVTFFSSILASAASASASETGASQGKAGLISRGADRQILVDEKGWEYTQLVEKGLMGATFLNQIYNSYLTDAKIGNGVENTELEADKNYTAMEHHWDEAFGYWGVNPEFDVDGENRFLGNYTYGRESYLGSATKLRDAFLKGRTAIVNKAYEIRDEQRDIIYAEFELIAAATAIHYINESIADLSGDDQGSLFHHASEGYGFAMALKYSPYKQITTEELNEVLNAGFGTNGDFWTISVTSLNNAKNILATAYPALTDIADEL